MGGRDKRVLGLGLDRLSTFGLLKGRDRVFVQALFDELISGGYLVIRPEHKTLEPTPKAREVLFHGGTVTVRMRLSTVAPKAERAGAKPSHDRKNARTDGFDEADNDLLDALKALRLSIARDEGVPLYVVFSNATLTEIARRRPKTVDDLLSIPGIGTVKASRYGRLFLDTVSQYPG